MSTDGKTEAQTDEEQSLEERVDELEEMLDDRTRALRNDQQSYRQQVVKPKLEDAEDKIASLESQVQSLAEAVESQQAEMAAMKDTIDNLHGVEEPSQTSPDKRVQDLKQAMIRRAEAGNAAGGKKVQLWWREVQALFADLGHGEISKPDCYKAMNDAIDSARPFEEGQKLNSNGNNVKAIRLDFEELRPEEVGSNPTTTTEVTDSPETGVSTTTD